MNKPKIIIPAIVILIFAGIFWSKSLQNNGSNIISSSGIHWHSSLAIIIDGEALEIPANIGLQGGAHLPIHTHDDEADIRETGGIQEGRRALHLEFGSTVRVSDIRLDNFFKNWDKTFSSECIFDNCTDSGTLEMFVNGKTSTEFENYVMGDRDEIQIIFTTGSGRTVTSADNAPEGSMHNLSVPDAAAAVRTHVANELEISEGVVIIMTAFEKEWPNSCLGLSGYDEMCAQVITPGYEVSVQVEGDLRKYRTNEDGSVLRREE